MRDASHPHSAPCAEHSSTEATLVRTYTSASTTTKRAALAVSAFALENSIGPACRARIGGAVAEVVDNAVRRAYPRHPGPIHVHARRTHTDLHVTIEDHGVGFDVARLDEDLLAMPLHSGLSRAISLSEHLRIESEPGRGTRVDLRFTATHFSFEEARVIDLCDQDFLMPDGARRVLHALRRPETAHMHQLSPALAVVVGRLLSGPEPRALAEHALWS